MTMRSIPEENPMSAAEEADYWNGRGDITFYVVQNVPKEGLFEIDVLEYSGCAGGLDETLGIEYSLENGILGRVDPSELREGVTYTLHGLTSHWTRGDGWTVDDDVEYEIEDMTSHTTLWRYLSQKAKNLWWRSLGYRIENLIVKWRLRKL